MAASSTRAEVTQAMAVEESVVKVVAVAVALALRGAARAAVEGSAAEEEPAVALEEMGAALGAAAGAVETPSRARP